MSKPSAFTWATSGPITTPTSGKMAAGFAPGERGAAQYFNYLLNLLGSWTGWLTAGILDGSYEVTGNLQVDGTTTLTGNVTTGLTLASNQNLTLQGTGDIKHGTFTRYLHASGGAGNMTANGGGNAVASGASQGWNIPLPLRGGDRLKAGGVIFVFQSGGGGTKALSLSKVDPATGLGTALFTVNDTTSSGVQQHNLLSADYQLPDGFFYTLNFSAAISGDTFYGVEIQWDRP